MFLRLLLSIFSVFTHLCGYKLFCLLLPPSSMGTGRYRKPLNTEASSSHDRPECLQPLGHHKVCSGRSHRAGLPSPWPGHMLVFLRGNSPKIPPCLQLLVATTVATGAEAQPSPALHTRNPTSLQVSPVTLCSYLFHLNLQPVS